MLFSGQKFGHFEVLEQIGAGGMGVVFKARDNRLGRLVALKVLQPSRGGDDSWRARLVREARAASSLNHPNIVTVYESGSVDGLDYIAMEYVEGAVLADRIPPGGMPLDQTLAVAKGVAAALAVAHTAGVVHRDLKPANVMLRSDGVVKVMDFGLAKSGAFEPAAGAEDATQTAGQTAAGTVLGSGPYMSPEQAEGKPVDARSDVFSFGALLYEMLTGRRAFKGETLISTISAVLKDTPAPVHVLRDGIPADWERLVDRCLCKNPDSRYASAGEIGAALADLRTSPAHAPAGPSRKLLAIAAAAALVLLAAGTWWGVRQWRTRWVYHQAIPEVYRLAAGHHWMEAYNLIQRAAEILPGDPVLESAIDQSGATMTEQFESDPPGAQVYFRLYADPGAPERFVGKTPIKARLPRDFVYIRMTREGFENAEGSAPANPALPIRFVLDPQGKRPQGMVAVPAGSDTLGGRTQPLPAYWLDKYEVTNRRFKAFVDQGGYSKRQYWKQPVLKEGRELPWEDAMRLFLDATGRPGPATWELGSYPEGQADYPVGGVSWNEAAAFAEFEGKSLPTVAHWRRAADFGLFSEILEFSNASGKGPAPVGKFRGIGPFGTYDMAGNVREWCFNAVGDSRALLGGAWNEAAYHYRDFVAADPLERLPVDGFRCAKYGQAPPAGAFEPIRQPSRDPNKEKPVGDETFRAYRNAFAYDRGPLDAKVEAVDEPSEYYRREKITYAAAYGGERILAWLFLPKNATPPYQTVVYYPSSDALAHNSSAGLGPQTQLVYIMRSGRALLHPVYKGTYERLGEPVSGPNGIRERLIQRGKDLGRSIDYLETRSDIDRTRLAYYGFSLGAREGVVMNAVESRFRAAILAWGGIPATRAPDGTDSLDFAPRVTVPVLMINGRNDFLYPYATGSAPLLRLLGTPEKDKKMVLFDVGHVALFSPEMVRESIQWLDRYLGPVK